MFLNKKFSSVFFSVLGGVIGFIGWNTNIYGFALLLLIPSLWLTLSTRKEVFLFIIFYYCLATKELFIGAGVYFEGDLLKSIFYWASLQVILTSGWIIFWKKDVKSFKEISIRIFLTCFITAFFPPYIFLGIAHPLTASGLYFPQMHLLGILIFIFLSILISYSIQNTLKKNVKIIKTLLVGVVVLSLGTNIIAKTKTPPKNWYGVNLKLGQFPEKLNGAYNRHQLLKQTVEEYINKGVRVIIFPEAIAGRWTYIEKRLWQDIDDYAKIKNVVVLLGAHNVVSQSKYDNVLIIIGDKTRISESIVKARIPMPVGNWRPFTKWSATLNLFSKPIKINGQLVTILVCWEQMLVFPIIDQQISNQSNFIIACSNIWWAKETKIYKIMQQTVWIWGRLFDNPILQAANI